MKRLTIHLQMYILMSMLSINTALACNVPVFRYALERWPSDPYPVVVVHDGPLTMEENALLTSISDEYGPYAVAFALDKQGDIPEGAEAILEHVEGKELPAVAVYYPDDSFGEGPPATTFNLNQSAIDDLMHGQLRKRVAEAIIGGDSVVWVLVKSGKTDLDQKAKKTLDQSLQTAEKEFVLPELDATDYERHVSADAKVDLKLSFRHIAVTTDDARDPAAMDLLLNRAPSLDLKDGPIAFAFFGRGRVIGPIPHEYIKSDVINDVNLYLVSACSCQVKQDNPGWDMLFAVAWDELISGELTLAEAMPPLSTPAAAASLSVVPVPIDAARLQAWQWRFPTTWFILSLVGFAVLAFGTLIVRRMVAQRGAA